MTYRDDREALHHRVAQLEQELQDARREGEEHGRDDAQARAAALEQRLAGMRAELETMGAELDALRGGKPRRGRGVILAAAGMAVVLVSGGAAALLLREPARPAPPPPPPPPAVEPQAAPQAPIPLQPLDPRELTAPVPTDPPSSSPASRSTTARWNAKVTRAEGLAIAAGTGCTVEATIATSDTNASVKELSIQCGTQSLYRSTDRLNGMSQRASDAREVLGPADDKSTFTLAYRDLGPRTGERAQIDLDTTHRQASVFRETIPRFRVELSVPATSTEGAPLSGPDQRLRRAGKVRQVTGSAPVKIGASCVLRAMATGKRADCVAELACGRTIVLPSTAPVECLYEASRPTTITTRDGPTGLKLEGSTLSVKGAAFGAEIALDDP
jgi:hypothetical protein